MPDRRRVPRSTLPDQRTLLSWLFVGRLVLSVGILLCLAGLASASLSLNLYAVAQMFAGPRASGTWVGFQNSLGNLSGIIMPIVTGIVVQRMGYDSAFVLTAAVALFGAVWWLVAVPEIEQIALD